MEVISNANGSFYMMSAPTSPSRCSNLNSMYFYSVPTSPIKEIGLRNASLGYESDVNFNFDDFEFETSKKFRLKVLEFDTDKKCQNFEYQLNNHQRQRRQRGDTLPSMAFADELFSNGQVLPLKPPPRLQRANGLSPKNTSASSPRSPSSVFKISFRRPSTWNDEFDPFVVALDKVKEEKRRTSHHRRARSLSPFRTTNTATTTAPQHENIKWDQQYENKQVGPLEPMQKLQIGPNRNEVIEYSKGAAYARWYRRESKQIDEPKKSSKVEKISSKGPQKHEGSGFGKRVRPVKAIVGQEGTIVETDEANGGNVGSKRERVKGLIRKYASFGREKNDVKLKEQIAAIWKKSYLRRLTSKFKENDDQSNNANGKVNGEPNMELPQYQPRLARCMSFGGQKKFKEHV
ncbi:unnamed protein product [Camellia sinensis]